jgi:transcriptional regulator with XRE-family HTH domain
VKLDEIARLAGVSRTTASYVINGKAKQYRVSDKTVEKVMNITTIRMLSQPVCAPGAPALLVW